MELLARNRPGCAGDRPASGRIPMLSGHGRKRSILSLHAMGQISAATDRHIIKSAFSVERFLNNIKHAHRISSRYDKTALSFAAMLFFGT